MTEQSGGTVEQWEWGVRWPDGFTSPRTSEAAAIGSAKVVVGAVVVRRALGPWEISQSGRADV